MRSVWAWLSYRFAMSPVIGITCGYDNETGRWQLHQDYVRSIEASGGLPLLLPSFGDAALVSRTAALIDGLLLAGGQDIDPLHFGEEPRGTAGITPLRDSFELAILTEITVLKKPVLGICRGVQVLNVFGGGDIYQDLPLQYPEALTHNQQAPAWYGTHTVRLEEDSLIGRVYGCTVMRVNTFHHQAIRRPAPGYRVSARSEDGLAEAVEHRDLPFVVGVQWHPERMWKKDKQQLRLFQAFVTACG